MRAITLHQPWATAIALGIKTAETRTWAPWPRLYGQRIAIHAGAKVVPPHQARPVWIGVARALRDKHGPTKWPQQGSRLRDLPRKAIVATAVLEGAGQVLGHINYRHGAHRAHLSNDQLHRIDPYGDYSEGRWIWILRDIRPVPPYPIPGRQGLWRLPDHAVYHLG